MKKRFSNIKLIFSVGIILLICMVSINIGIDHVTGNLMWRPSFNWFRKVTPTDDVVTVSPTTKPITITPVKPTTLCKDLDGEDSFTKSYVDYNNNKYEDYCVKEETGRSFLKKLRPSYYYVNEYVCSNDKVSYKRIRCRNGCKDGACIKYKLGLVYIYYNKDTYNPNWKKEFQTITSKIINGIKEVTNNEINPTIDILGEVQVDTFCWNPAIVGGKFRNIELGGESYFLMPGSQFSNSGVGLTGFEIVESYCNNCIIDGDLYRINCDNDLSYKNLWQTNKLSKLNEEISKKLGINFEDYNGIFIIFGKAGQILPEENEKTKEYRCLVHGGIIGGYSNLIMAENFIKAGRFVDCKQFGSGSFYDKIGWHTMVHEILHRFGAVDVYETGTIFGVKSYREEALKIDPLTDESIMGNDYRLNCMEEGDMELDGNICTQSELERVYLDKYNKQRMGLK